MTRIEEIKKRKPFALWDLLVYGILLVVILILFAVFVFGGGGEKANGIEVTVDGETIYTYTFGEGGASAEGWSSRIEERVEDETVFVKIFFGEEKQEYNEIKIDPANRTAVMNDANCSRGKDCMLMQISDESGVIICLPHKLKICALGGEKIDYFHPTVG